MNGIGVLAGIAFAHLAVRTRQTLVAILGVAIGVGFFLAVSGMMTGSQTDFIRTLIDTAPHIIVQDEQRNPARQPAVTAWPQAAVAVRFAGRTEPLSLNGIDPRIEGQLTKIEASLVGGHLTDLEARPDGIIISRPLANRVGARLGDTLLVSSSAGVLQRMRILALIEPDARAGFYAGDNAAYGLLRTAQVLFARPNVVNQLHIKLGDPQAAEGVAVTLEARWGYKWVSWQERSRDIRNLLVVRNVIMYAVIAAILLVASFGIYTSVSTSVTDKRRDLAILRAMGCTEGDVEGVVLIEGLVVGVAGALVGFAFGSVLLEVLARLPITVQGKPLELPLDRGLRQYLIAGAASLASALVAAWLPARKAAGVDPVDILRGAA